MTTQINGTGNLTMDESGNVGIGATSPVKKLTTLGDIGIVYGSALCFTDGSSRTFTADKVIYNYWDSGYDRLQIQPSGSSNGIITFNAGAAATTRTERMRIDASGNVLVTNPAGLGYGTGSGGTVTQATSKSTAVTLNKPTGQITMNAAALAAGASVAFQLNNSVIGSADTLLVTPNWATNSTAYRAQVSHCSAGAAVIVVTNASGGSLSEALIINFAIIKGAAA